MNASDVMHYGHQTVLGAVDGLPIPAWESPGVCGEWSVRQIIAHLASYELVLVDILKVAVEPVATPYLDRFREGNGRFNDAEVATRASLSAEETLAEYTAAHDAAMLAVARLPSDQLRQPGTLPWYGDAYSLDDLIVYMYYGHKREHCAQIAVYRDRAGC